MSENALLVNVEYSQLSVAEVRDGRLFDFEVEQNNRLVGNIYLGQVETILPGMDAAFIDIGLRRNALIYAGDIGLTPGNLAHNVAHDNNVNAQNLPIEKLLRGGDKIVVQIARAPLGSKGARVTGHLSLLGRYIVLATNAENVGVSRRIENAAERERLRRLVEKLRPLDHSVIVRTEAAGVSEQELAQDVRLLLRQLERIESKAATINQPTLLYRETGLLGRVVRDRLNDKINRIVVDSPVEYSMLREMVEMTLPHLADRVHLHQETASLFSFHGLEDDLSALNERLVPLPRGGYLAIDEAEALTAIDVNTGRFVGKSRLADTVLQTNLEAAAEAARQLRLRNIGGIIVIDFIDMEQTRDRVKVMDALEKALKEDRARTRIVQLSPLGLVEMTRRRDGDTLRQSSTDECPYCDGEGRIQSPSNVALQTARAVRNAVAEHQKTLNQKQEIAAEVTLHPLVAVEFLGNDNEAISALEAETKTPISLFVSPTFHQEASRVEIMNASQNDKIDEKYREGARFEIAAPAWLNDEMTFATINRRLVRVDDTAQQSAAPTSGKNEEKRISCLVEVIRASRWFLEVRFLVSGEPKISTAAQSPTSDKIGSHQK